MKEQLSSEGPGFYEWGSCMQGWSQGKVCVKILEEHTQREGCSLREFSRHVIATLHMCVKEGIIALNCYLPRVLKMYSVMFDCFKTQGKRATSINNSNKQL